MVSNTYVTAPLFEERWVDENNGLRRKYFKIEAAAEFRLVMGSLETEITSSRYADTHSIGWNIYRALIPIGGAFPRWIRVTRDDTPRGAPCLQVVCLRNSDASDASDASEANGSFVVKETFDVPTHIVGNIDGLIGTRC